MTCRNAGRVSVLHFLYGSLPNHCWPFELKIPPNETSHNFVVVRLVEDVVEFDGIFVVERAEDADFVSECEVVLAGQF